MAREIAMTDNELEQWLAGRKKAGGAIDVATCEITWRHGQVLDPYGVRELTPEEYQIGRLVFVRSPESDGWVSLYDLPKESAHALWQRIDSEGIPEKDEWAFPDEES
jgi:hypothetical protein